MRCFQQRTELDRPGQMVEWADGQSDRRMYLEQGGDFSVLFLLRKVERGSAVLSRGGRQGWARQKLSTSSSYTVLGPTHIVFRPHIRPRSDEHLGDLRRLIAYR